MSNNFFKSTKSLWVVHVKTQQGFVTGHFRLWKENWSTLIDLQLLIVQTDVCVSTIKRLINHCAPVFFFPSGVEFCPCVLTCQGSVQCSRVLRTVVGRPSGSKLWARPPESLYPTHTELELNTKKQAYNYLLCEPRLEAAVGGVFAYWPGVEDLSDTLLLRGGRSSSSLKLLSWFGSKSSSAAMLSISRLTAPLDGCKNTHRSFNFTALIVHLMEKRISTDAWAVFVFPDDNL